MPRLLVALALLAAGCATSLSATHTASTVPKGDFEFAAHSGLMAPVGVLARAFEDGRDAARQIATQAEQGGQVQVPEGTARLAMVAAAALIAGPPSLVQELTVRYGATDWLDVGFRYSGPAFRLESHAQVLKTSTWKVAAGLGVARHAFGGGLLDLLETLDLASFKRTDVDVVFIAGVDSDVGAFYFGPKFVWSKFSSDGILVKGDELAITDANGDPLAQVQFDLGSSFLYGGVVGGRIGWKYVWLSAELSVYGSRYRPNILGVEVDLGGLIIYPTVGIAGRF